MDFYPLFITEIDLAITESILSNISTDQGFNLFHLSVQSIYSQIIYKLYIYTYMYTHTCTQTHTFSLVFNSFWLFFYWFKPPTFLFCFPFPNVLSQIHILLIFCVSFLIVRVFKVSNFLLYNRDLAVYLGYEIIFYYLITCNISFIFPWI